MVLLTHLINAACEFLNCLGSAEEPALSVLSKVAPPKKSVPFNQGSHSGNHSDLLRQLGKRCTPNRHKMICQCHLTYHSRQKLKSVTESYRRFGGVGPNATPAGAVLGSLQKADFVIMCRGVAGIVGIKASKALSPGDQGETSSEILQNTSPSGHTDHEWKLKFFCISYVGNILMIDSSYHLQ